MYLEYQDLPAAKFREKLIDCLYENPDMVFCRSLGHTEQFHIAQSDGQLLSRIVHDEKMFSGCFEDAASADDLTALAIVNATLKGVVDKWLQTRRQDFQDKSDYQQLVIVMPLGEPVGRGFDSAFREIKTSAITVVLQRDFEEQTPFGFFLKTAYPDLTNQKHAYYTGLAYSKQQVADLPDISFDSPYQETAFRLTGSLNCLDIRNNADINHNEYIRILFPGNKPRDRIAVYITSNDMRANYYTSETSKIRMNPNELSPQQRDVIALAQRELNIQIAKRNPEILNNLPVSQRMAMALQMGKEDGMGEDHSQRSSHGLERC